MRANLLIQALVIIGAIFVASVAWSEDAEFAHPGYIEDVADERLQVTREIVIVPYQEPVGVSVMDKIFTEKMTKEFSREFRYRFGYTEFEQLEFTSNRIVESSDSGRQVQFEDYLEKQEDFGKYLAKELTEYHVDNYLKGNRSTRGIYKAKQAISNIQVNTEGGYKFKIRYKITTNRVQAQLEKPGEKFHKSVDTKLDGSEAVVHLVYDVTKTVAVGTDSDVVNEMYALRGVKRLSPELSTSITAQSFTRDLGDTPKQDRILLGLNWND